MSSLNLAVIMGNLGRDPELRQTPNGGAVTTLSVATTHRSGGKDGAQVKEETTWHNVVVWGKTAEACAKYLKKGSAVLVEGRIQTRSWEKDGEKKYTTEIVASNCQFVGGKGQLPAEGASASTQKPAHMPAEVAGDDELEVPF